MHRELDIHIGHSTSCNPGGSIVRTSTSHIDVLYSQKHSDVDLLLEDVYARGVDDFVEALNLSLQAFQLFHLFVDLPIRPQYTT